MGAEFEVLHYAAAAMIFFCAAIVSGLAVSWLVIGC